MQTETIFRAARALHVIGSTINAVHNGNVQHSFRGNRSDLIVVLTGRTDEGLEEVVRWINGRAVNLPAEDRFQLRYWAANEWLVEAA